MQLKADALVARLERPDTRLPPVVWIHGDEALVALEAADAVRSKARTEGCTEREVLHVERGFRASMLTARAGSLSLFAERRLVELRFNDTRAGKEYCRAVCEALPALLQDADLRLLVTSPRIDWKLLKANALAEIDRAGWLVEAPAVDRNRLPQWIAQRLARQGQQADAQTLALLAARTEGNLLAAGQEVMKLGLLCPPGRLDAQAVHAAVQDVSRFEVFDTTGALLAGDAARALRALEALRAEGVAPQQVAWWLGDVAHKLARINHARQPGGEGVQAAISALKIFRQEEQRALAAAAQRLDAATCRRALGMAAEVDRIGKGVAPGEPWSAMARLVALLAGVPVPAPFA